LLSNHLTIPSRWR